MGTSCLVAPSAAFTGCSTRPWTRRVRENLIAGNPTEGITLPKKKTAPNQILNDAQLEKFMDVIQKDEVWQRV